MLGACEALCNWGVDGEIGYIFTFTITGYRKVKKLPVLDKSGLTGNPTIHIRTVDYGP